MNSEIERIEKIYDNFIEMNKENLKILEENIQNENDFNYVMKMIERVNTNAQVNRDTLSRTYREKFGLE